jgi:rhodanese-related sulfurtransferase
VPRRSTRIVLCDDNDGLAERAAAILAQNGYGDVRILSGGIAAWSAAGFELFPGVNVPSKAFGEYIEHANGTPSIAAGELEALIRGAADMVVLDSRPFDEYVRVSIPTAINVPGAELVLRARDIAPSPDTLVVVNCAGRTRSIIGAQSLINAGLPNKVVALRNGTMGWSLEGFACEEGKNRRAPDVSPAMRDWARQAAWRVAQSCGVRRIDGATVKGWRADNARTLYIFDVRDPAEFEAGHVAGAISAPGYVRTWLAESGLEMVSMGMLPSINPILALARIINFLVWCYLHVLADLKLRSSGSRYFFMPSGAFLSYTQTDYRQFGSCFCM